MFEAAELGRTISKREFERQLPGLRAQLVQAEYAVKRAKIPVMIILSGVDGAGKGEVIHRLNEWLDPRGLDIHAYWHQSQEERERPFYWSFWQTLPARGRLGVMFGSWYTEPMARRLYGKIKDTELDAALRRIVFSEEMLINDGALIIKLWFHLSKPALHQRLSSLQKSPEHHWRVLPTDWAHHKLYDKFIKVAERTLRATDTASAPWRLVESTSSRFRDLMVARIILEAINKRLAQSSKLKVPARGRRLKITTEGERTVLDKVDLGQRLEPGNNEDKLAKFQARLNRIVWAAYEKKIPSVIVFEGWDAAGKGSCIRRVTAALDPRLFRVVPVGAPTDEERAHHYLWRFWRQLPADGMMTIFDRSWYGRVLVERVEGFARPHEWMRAYAELNDFEEQLSEHGAVIGKYWIHISKDEQLRRFRDCEAVPFKRFKINDEDWRNRKKWEAHQVAVHDMVAHTSTEFAPWTLVAGNDKRFARIQILKSLCDKLEEGALNPELLNLKRREDQGRRTRSRPSREAVPLSDFLRRSLKQQWRGYRKEFKRCRRKFSEDSVHELRVSIRRLLATLGVLTSVVPAPGLAHAQRTLKKRLKIFAKLRDTQTQLGYARIMREHFAAAGRYERALRRREKRLVKRAHRKLPRARPGHLTKVVATLRKRLRTGQRVREQRRFAAMREALRATYADVLTRHRAIDPADTRTLHQTRVAFKKFRYMMEALQPWLPGVTRQRLRAMHDYQTQLGEIQDLVVLIGDVDKFVKKHDTKEKVWPPFRAGLVRRRAGRIKRFMATKDKLFEFHSFQSSAPGP